MNFLFKHLPETSTSREVLVSYTKKRIAAQKPECDNWKNKTAKHLSCACGWLGWELFGYFTTATIYNNNSWRRTQYHYKSSNKIKKGAQLNPRTHGNNRTNRTNDLYVNRSVVISQDLGGFFKGDKQLFRVLFKKKFFQNF